jgi:hypothetical protein
MQNKLLKMNWDDIMNSDYVFKSNMEKHVVQIFGDELEAGDDSLILIYYNVYTNEPMLMLQRYNRKGAMLVPEEVDGYTMTREEDTDEDGSDYTEITYVLRSLQEALQG